MDQRSICERYQEVAQELIQEEETLADIANSKAQIICLSSTHKKKTRDRIIHAECEKVSDKYKWGIPCDFTITVFEPNVEHFTEEQIRILLHHELLHVGVEFKADGTEAYYTKPHDLEDFKIIIKKYGADWSDTDED